MSFYEQWENYKDRKAKLEIELLLIEAAELSEGPTKWALERRAARIQSKLDVDRWEED